MRFAELKRGHIPDILCFLVLTYIPYLLVQEYDRGRYVADHAVGAPVVLMAVFSPLLLCEYLQLVVVVSGVMVYSHSFHIPLSSSFLCVTSKPSPSSLRAGCWREACPRPEISEKSYHGPAPSLQITKAQQYVIGVENIIAVSFSSIFISICTELQFWVLSGRRKHKILFQQYKEVNKEVVVLNRLTYRVYPIYPRFRCTSKHLDY